MHFRDFNVGLPEGCELRDFFDIFHCAPTVAEGWRCNQCERKTSAVYERWDALSRFLCFKCMWREGTDRCDKRNNNSRQ